MTSQKIRKKRATEAERQVAADLGGRKTFLSGAGSEKADVVVPHKTTISGGVLRETTLFSFRVEVKTTESDGYTLSSKHWQNVLRAAEKTGQEPVFVMKISIRNAPVEFCAIRSDFFSGLTGWHEVPLAASDVGKKSLRITRNIRSSMWWGTGNITCRRIWLNIDPPGGPMSFSRKGDIVILAYSDFLQLVKAAEARR